MNEDMLDLQKNIQYSRDFFDEVDRGDYSKEAYKILIADDALEIRTATKMVLKDFEFGGKRLTFIETKNSSETIAALKEHPDIAVIILDIVMDESDSGLKIVEYIRNELKNMFIRIIVRTGQPGQAPEEKVITSYDINDYLTKTEITVQRLFTCLYQALRAYRDMIKIENNRKGLEKIVNISSKMFLQESVEEIFYCIFNELKSFHKDENGIYSGDTQNHGGLVYLNTENCPKVIAATGNYEKYLNKDIKDIEEMAEIYRYAAREEHMGKKDVLELYGDFLVWAKRSNEKINFIFLQSGVEKYDVDLIKVFLLNYSRALDSYISSQKVMKTQVEIIQTLSEAIENRSRETANHVRRVAELTYLLARKIGFDEDVCRVLRMASTMHDVGKIGIPDSILLKPGRLTDEEFGAIQTHTEIGHKIFKNSELEILKRAANICLCHHEKCDGTGYPKRLMGDNIPIEAKIVAVVDVFDALIHERCYKKAWTIEEALEYIKAQSGMQFDPKIVEVFIENIEGVLEIINLYKD